MDIRKALTFRASSIGDCLMGKYLLENVRAQFPHARLGIVIAGRTEMIRDLFAAYPWLEVIEANRRSPASLLSLARRFYGSDLVVTQYAGKPGGRFSFASKLMARFLAKRGGLVGFTDSSRWNTVLYDRLIPVRSDIAVAEHDREALRKAGLSTALPFPTLEFIQDDSAREKFHLEKGKYLIVQLFSGAKGRGLHSDKKRTLLAALAKEFPDLRLVISGGAADKEEVLQVAEHVPATVIAGEATLQELMNLISDSRGVVSVDTGIAHIAAQIGTPLVVLRTCLGPNWWLPDQYGISVPITVCSHDTSCAAGHSYGNYPPCINGISIGEVIEAVGARLRPGRSGKSYHA